MDVNNAKHQYRLQTWAPIVRNCKSSGMTVRAWCEENDVNEKQFYYWQRRVREELLQSVAVQSSQQSGFYQIPDHSVNNSAFKPDMVLNIGSLRMELSNTVSSELLSKVMKVIHHA